MYATPEQFSASSKLGVEALVGLANAHFAALERLFALNFSKSKSAFENCLNYARTLSGDKDAQDFVSMSATTTPFAALERLSALNLSMSKSAFDDCVKYMRSLTEAKDAQEFVNLNTAAAQPTLEKALAYSRKLYEVSTQAQGEFTKALEAQSAEFNNKMAELLENFSKNAPPGSEAAIAAVKSALAAANSAYDRLREAAKQANDAAEANFSAAMNTAAKKSDEKTSKAGPAAG